MSIVYINNIGLLLSGDVAEPILKADALVVEDGLICEVGKADALPVPQGAMVIDAAGGAVMPGLIDSHCHVVFGDYTPRQLTVNFLESELHGGVTTAISAGEVHLPGRPKDPAGVKALAVLAAKSFQNYRPGGMKVLGGAVILEKGLTEADFEELAGQGVRVVGEVGLGSVKDPQEAAPMITWAKKAGMVVMMHTGGTSIPGSSTVSAEMVLAADPDIVSHINGGPTAVSPAEALKLIQKTAYTLEIVHCGNPLRAVEVSREIHRRQEYHRIIIGNDAPSGTGVIPLGLLRTLNLLCSLGETPPEMAVAMATGNTAGVFGLNRGVIAPGKEADLVFLDASLGSAGDDLLSCLTTGDNPGISIVMVDGKVLVKTSRNTPPPKRAARVVS
ncbi:MAG: amidohydrolase family protein [Desulfobacterota bacterium]|nr:amidohydrolase family protein [Thermodesulfobacteriota bacterium]